MAQNEPANAGQVGWIPGSGRFRWRRKWQPTPVFPPGKSHGQKSLVGYSPGLHALTPLIVSTTLIIVIIILWAKENRVSSRAKRSDLNTKHFSLDLVWSTEGDQSRYQETLQEAHTIGPGGWLWGWGEGGTAERCQGEEQTSTTHYQDSAQASNKAPLFL